MQIQRVSTLPVPAQTTPASSVQPKRSFGAVLKDKGDTNGRSVTPSGDAFGPGGSEVPGLGFAGGSFAPGEGGMKPGEGGPQGLPGPNDGGIALPGFGGDGMMNDNQCKAAFALAGTVAGAIGGGIAAGAGTLGTGIGPGIFGGATLGGAIGGFAGAIVCDTSDVDKNAVDATPAPGPEDQGGTPDAGACGGTPEQEQGGDLNGGVCGGTSSSSAPSSTSGASDPAPAPAPSSTNDDGGTDDGVSKADDAGGKPSSDGTRPASDGTMPAPDDVGGSGPNSRVGYGSYQPSYGAVGSGGIQIRG